MNKKFSTLAASALLACAFSTNAVEFRAPLTRAGFVSPTDPGITKIIGDKWYQLQTEDGKFLVQHRDLITGEVLTTLVDPNEQEVALLPSLWRIQYVKTDGQGGGKYTFVNKETNLPLSYDHVQAIDAKNDLNNVTPTAAAMNVEGCNTTWEWYLFDEQTSPFDFQAPYSYFHTEKTDSVMALKEINGIVYAIKEKATNIVNNHDISGSVVRVRPVEAAAIALNSYDINTMIDFHKPSVDKKWASFLFNDPASNLIDPESMDIERDVMKEGDKYQAEPAYALLYDIKAMALGKDLDENQMYKDAVAKLEAAEKVLDEAEEDAAEQQTVVTGWKNTVKYWEQLAEDKTKAYETALDLFEKGDVEGHALGMAEGLASAFDKLVQASNTFKEPVDKIKDSYNSIANAKDEVEKVELALECKAAAIVVYNSAAEFQKAYIENYEESLALFTSADEVLYNNLKDATAIKTSADSHLTDAQTGLSSASSLLEQKKAAVETAKTEVLREAIVVDDIMGDVNDDVRYIVENNFQRLQYMNDNKGTYLMVDTAFWENTANPRDAHLILSHNTPKADDHEAIAARYFFKFTYHPTADSLVIEPLNASVISNAEFTAHTAWKVSKAGTQFISDTDVDNNLAEAASNTWTADVDHKPVVVKANKMGGDVLRLTAEAAREGKYLDTRISFDNPYDYLTRTTLANGVYLLNYKAGSRDMDGKSFVMDMAGVYQFENAETSQNYQHMPATQWVIEKTSCETDNSDARVRIVNREYETELFEGHLYTDGKGGVFSLHRDKYFGDYDTLAVEKIAVNDLGYLNLNGEEIENAYNINMFLNYGENNKSLSVVATSADTLLRAVDADDACRFEFIPVAENVKYGYNSEKAGTKQLLKSVYKIKVKDADKINNDHKVVGVNDEGKYCVVDSLDMTDASYIAYFTLKENNCWEGEHYYSLVQVAYDAVNNVVYDLEKLAVEGSQMDTKQSDLTEIHTDAFRLLKDTMPYYRRVVGLKNEKFYSTNNENRTLGESVIDGVSYMNIFSIAEEPTRNNEFFLDTAHVSVSSMPTYLLALDVQELETDSCNHEDHPAIGDHYQVIKYRQGRYMIDAAKTEIIPDYLKDKVKPFENVYTRYAFVNAIHYKDTLYIMNSADATIQYDRDLYDHKNVDTALVLKPKAYEGASIAFRLHDQSDDENFYIETSGEQYGYASDGNTWLKEQNQNIVSTGRGVYSETGDHNGWNWHQNVYEDIYQALLLNTTAQSGSTANEDIEVSAVKVIAGNGQITINGAAGKKVVVSNILGQVVANTVLTSDNATIAAPQGVVVVAVEGEEAVKAIVK